MKDNMQETKGRQEATQTMNKARKQLSQRRLPKPEEITKTNTTTQIINPMKTIKTNRTIKIVETRKTMETNKKNETTTIMPTLFETQKTRKSALFCEKIDFFFKKTYFF